MNILDENIPASQREQLRAWRIRVSQIGLDIGRPGMPDDEIVAFLRRLRRLRRPTFFTRDDDFFKRVLCDARHSIVFLAAGTQETAHFVRRVLRHPDLDTQVKRMGTVVRASGSGLSLWRPHASRPRHLAWT